MRRAAKAIGCIITLCFTVGLLIPLTNITERKSSDNKYADFFQDRSYDVLFMGTSHVMNGVFPMELWKDYGITSYNFGGHSNQMATTYWVMENALDYVTPKVMVIDCLSLSSDWKCSDKFSYLHQSLDAFPLSVTKIRAVWDLLDDPGLDAAAEAGKTRESPEPRTRIGLLWDFSVYHSRWNELKKDDFIPSSNKEKGAESRIAVTRGKIERIDSNIKTEPGHVGEKYLRKMIESCQKRGIAVVLMYLPFPASKSKQADANRVYDIAEEYDVPYINFLDMEIIDYQTDLYDKSSHVNPSGARKITSYIGGFLVNNFDLLDRRDEISYSYWTEDYEEYEMLKNTNITKQDDIVKYLMLLSGDDINTIIYIQNKDIFNNKWILSLLENIGINTNDLDLNTDFILVKNKSKEVVMLKNCTDGKTEITDFGNVISMRSEDKEKSYLTLEVGEWESSITVEENANIGMQINVFRDGKLVDSVKFIYSVDPVTSNVNTSSVIR